MKAKDLVKISFNDKDIEGIIITIMDSYDNNTHWYIKYLCYAQNRLFTISEEGISYPETEDCYALSVTTYHMGEVFTDYAVIPEYDSILNAENNNFININIE